MKFGFIIRRLALVGSGKASAEIIFERGLNVIAGPSDSGKSFIVQCLDYALGSGSPPKHILEAEGYETVVVDLEANDDGRIYSLQRSLRGGDVLCKSEGRAERVLAAKHQAGKEDTVSQFLLDLSGLGTKRVRTNEQGKTRPLSFRDIARLVIIDEEDVIKEDSPILSGQHITKTAESGVFRLLLTGTDDSSIVAKEDPKLTKGRQTGRVELLQDLLIASRARVAELGEFGSLIEEREALTRVEGSVQTALVERNSAQAAAVPLQVNRNAAWTKLKEVESKLAVQSELKVRFDLLGQQYNSDLRRLDAIAEAGSRLNGLAQERCPMCGARAEHQHHEHPKLGQAPEDVYQACKAEAAKTSKLLHDLLATQAANAADVRRLQSERDSREAEFATLSLELKDVMEHQVDAASKKVDDLRLRAEIARKAIEQLERIQELDELLVEANRPNSKPKSDLAGAAASTAQASSFSKQVGALLRAWHFPNLDSVSFSEGDQDIVISGRARKTHGKGVRAITRAAFNLALLRLCIDDERPFPNFVLIDSPLLVYEEPDAGDLPLTNDIKQNFWENVKSSFVDAQVIIIENSHQLPTDGKLRSVKIELFTGNDQGRKGFIPS